jgi:hypothetical protein
MIEENLKLKRFLKELFENQEFETTYRDEVTSWNDDEPLYEDYTFKYYIEVGEVVGEDDRAVASINVIIIDILKDGEDFYYDWKESDYSENAWYILELDRVIYEEKIQYIPISIYPTFYGKDEYKKQHNE